ncbi:enoyl-CoA hydratase/isomerase domain-containing protein [Trichoderma breve]|uniref:Enoyl-CoA hydratase/isomerase domain-containing protein n=1 Tax=Trichoderma breve TaxID=2034170 RepID=A0A9W9EBB6_9HYPO|nr:enoyl-CoA hydratase/isomerase domain-containing protein [Trichoderma breve]KAJ4863560.1 enoyl-CoA hydratase/isomerase domain-containing protein [Trichoderma breve]
MRLLTLIPLAIASIIHTATGAPATTAPSSVITTTKITPSYWRATFSDPPFNIQGNAFFRDFYALVDEITGDPNVKVVVFDSNSKYFFSTHVDLINTLDPDLYPVAAIRGRTYNAGAEIAAVLDVRFGSKEKAVLAQYEVGFGVNPGGGGIEMLSHLAGRSRALEVVLGNDSIDAETAALYGWINRAIPDAQFENFVDKFARRVAGWDHSAIAAAKNLINERTRFPTADEQIESFNSFLKADAPGGLVDRRLKAMAAAGMQTNLNFEENFGQEELKFIGSGPWNA